MKIAIFWNNIFTDKKRKVILSEAEQQKLFFYYLIEKNRLHNNFNYYFKDAQLKDLKIKINSTDILKGDEKLQSPEQWNDYDALFILAELDWHGNKITDFYGVRIAQKLRLNNVKCPVFICSFMPESYLIEKGQFKILNFRGHYFIHLPQGLTEGRAIDPLDDMELLDAQSFFCNTEGLISSIFHNKSNARGKKLNDAKNYLINEVYGRILNIDGLLEESRNVARSSIDKIKRIEKKEELEPLLNQNEATLLAPYQSGSQKNVYSIEFLPEGAWEMLILEDNEQQIKDLIHLVNERGNVKIHIANTYNDAQKIIREDRANKITIVICDYRLEEEGNIKGKQGYSFVQWLAKQNRFNEIFAYSGMARSFQSKIYEQFGIRVHSKNKNELYGKNLQEFVDELIYAGNRTWDIINSLPTAKQWDELKPFYSFFRSHANYQIWEDDISRGSNAIIEELISVIEKIEIDDNYLEDVNKKRIFNEIVKDNLEKCQIAQLKNLRAKNYIQKPITNSTIIPENSTIIEHQNGKKSYKILKEPRKKKYLDEFKSKMIARRVLIFFHFKYGLDRNAIYNLLDKGTVFENVIESYEEHIKSVEKEITKYIKSAKTTVEITNSQIEYLKKLVDKKETIENAQQKRKASLKQIPFNLAFQSTDYPGRLLVEEKNWLSRMGLIEIRKLISTVDKLEDFLFDFLEDNVKKINRRSDKLKELPDGFNWFKVDDSGNICLNDHEKFFFSLYGIRRVIAPLLDTWQDKHIGISLLKGCKNIVNSNSEIQSDYSVVTFVKFCNGKMNHAAK